MLCVCGGKLSEGINFKDDLGRLVIMVGLPYANPDDPELSARMKHLDAMDAATLDVPSSNRGGGSRGSRGSRGRAYYEALCMRSVNQVRLHRAHVFTHPSVSNLIALPFN
jgi:chromosome transmission fidelity protein 1